MKLHTSHHENTGVQQDDALQVLESAAEKCDEQTFIDAYLSISMAGRSEEDYERAMRLALTSGAHMVARELADRGAALYPGNAHLAKVSRILAPARVVGTRPAGPYNPNDDVEWLKANRRKYRGKWIAICGGELIAAADSLQELYAIVGPKSGALLTQG